MSEARDFMVVAYLLTIVTIIGYAVHLVLRSREVKRRLDAARRMEPSTDQDSGAEAETVRETEAWVGGHHVRA